MREWPPVLTDDHRAGDEKPRVFEVFSGQICGAIAVMGWRIKTIEAEIGVARFSGFRPIALWCGFRGHDAETLGALSAKGCCISAIRAFWRVRICKD